MPWDGQERRGFIRVNFPCKIMVHTAGEQLLESNTENLGVGGVRVILEEELEIFSIIGLEIHLKEEPIICEGRVVWVVKKESGWAQAPCLFDTGIEFYRIADEDMSLIDKLLKTVIKSAH